MSETIASMLETDEPTRPTGTHDPFAGAQIDRKKPAAAQIFDQLRAAITSLAIPPGATLARAVLAERFGVSQTPVREALLKLEEEGLVDTFPQSATRVSQIDLQSVSEAQFLRLAVELETVRKLAMEIRDIDLEPIEALIDRQARLLKRDNIPGFADADREMHRALMEIAGVPGLWGVIRSRSGHLDRLRHLHLPTPGKAQSVIEEHRAILQAIENGDPAAAQEALRAHLSGTIASVEELREQYPEYLKG